MMAEQHLSEAARLLHRARAIIHDYAAGNDPFPPEPHAFLADTERLLVDGLGEKVEYP